MISPDDPRIQEIVDSADSKAQAINELFDLGLTKSQIIKLDFKEATVRKEVNRRKAEGKDVPGTTPSEGSPFPVTTKGSEAILPEYLSGEISEYFDGSPEQQAIFKAGIMVPLMGMRLFAEMVKPLTTLINAMKGDQVTAMMEAMALGQQQAADAATMASQQTASQVIAAMKEGETARAVAGSANPMQAMAAQTMMPLFQNLMQGLVGRLMPGAASPQQETLPQGWKKTTK